MSAKKTTRTELLPQLVLEAIQKLSLKGFYFANAVQIVAAIIRLKNRDRLMLEDYKTISSTYFEAISQNYSPAISALKKANIVQVYADQNGKQYSTVAGLSKAYRINPELMSRSEAPVEFRVKTESFQTNNLSPEMEAWVLADLRGLVVDASKTRHAIQEHVELFDPSHWEITASSPEYALNSFLRKVRFGTNPSEYKYNTQHLVDKLLAKAENHGKSLFRQGEAYVIDTPQAFIARKNKHILRAWNSCVNNLTSGQFYAKKVATNNRVHTNITECPSDLLALGVITWNGEHLEEVDVANSQMACLAHVMLHGDVLQEGIDFPPLTLTDKAVEFIEGCQQGVIYNTMAALLGIRRDAAKTEMFRQVFGRKSTGTITWKKLQANFPEAAAWLDEVKTREIDLANYLQRFEAWVMIENVYPELKRAGLVAFSKHDSFLVPESQVEAVEGIIEAVFEHVGYVARLKNKTNKIQRIVIPAPIVKTTEPVEVSSKYHQASEDNFAFFASLDAKWEEHKKRYVH